MFSPPFRPAFRALILATGGCVLALLSPPVPAQPVQARQPASAAPADPADPGARVPEFRYQSGLARYRPLREAAPGSWQKANEATNRAGGWRAYAREQVAAEPSTTQPGSVKNGPPGHEGHQERKTPQGHQPHHGQHHEPR